MSPSWKYWSVHSTCRCHILYFLHRGYSLSSQVLLWLMNIGSGCPPLHELRESALWETNIQQNLIVALVGGIHTTLSEVKSKKKQKHFYALVKHTCKTFKVYSIKYTLAHTQLLPIPGSFASIYIIPHDIWVTYTIQQEMEGRRTVLH